MKLSMGARTRELFGLMLVALAMSCTGESVVGGRRDAGGMDAAGDVLCAAPQVACGSRCATAAGLPCWCRCTRRQCCATNRDS